MPKISQLPSTVTPTTSDVFPTVQSAITKKTTLGSLFDTLNGFVQAGSGAVAMPMQAKARGIFISAKDYGAVGDGVTDSTTALLAWAAHLSTLQDVKAEIPPGVYLCSLEIRVLSASLRNVSIDARGAEIVFTGAAASNKHWFYVRNTDSDGGICHIEGLTCRHNRATVRNSNTDMIAVAGFTHYYLDKLAVPSADNMGITVGRGDASSFSPETLVMIAPRVGGRYEAAQHSHGSVGDSGIWVVAAPQVTHIVAPYVESTGDDGILVGHSTNSAAGHCYITDADIRDCGGNGMCITVPNGRLTGRVDRTNQSGVSLQVLDGSFASQMRVDVEIRRPGQLQAGDIGTSMIPKQNPWGIWIYQSGTNAGEINLDGSSIYDSYSNGINLQTTTGSLSKITGRVKFNKIAERITGGMDGDGAIVRRSGTGTGVVKQVSLDCEVRDTQVPFVVWLNQGPTDDEKIDLKFRAYDCSVNVAYTSQALLNFEVIGGAVGRVKTTTIDADLRRCTFGQLLRVAGGNSSQDVTINVRDEAGDYQFRQGAGFVSNTGNARLYKARPIVLKRQTRWDGATALLLAELDPALPWMIEVFANDSADHGAYYKAFYEPIGNVVTPVTSLTGGNTTAVVAAYNAGNTTRFAAGTLEVRAAAAGYTAGASLDAIVIATPFADAASVALG